ncbi:hypothetical protein [Acinetobacter sp.]|uniref:hypothetical protein n=1 Tax=Acinetobacter sp. TaxID=472 RepID=UPI0035B2DA8F
MIERSVPKIGDTIKARFENFLGQVIVVTGVVRRIDSQSTIVGNDVESKQPFFVSLDEILEINHKSILSSSTMESLKEVS